MKQFSSIYWGTCPQILRGDTQNICKDIHSLGTFFHSQPIATIAESLSKMCLNSEVDAADDEFIVTTIPPTRPDVMHMADIVEDVAIAYGYDNIVKTQPKTNTTGEQVNIIAFCFLAN